MPFAEQSSPDTSTPAGRTAYFEALGEVKVAELLGSGIWGRDSPLCLAASTWLDSKLRARTIANNEDMRLLAAETLANSIKQNTNSRISIGVQIATAIMTAFITVFLGYCSQH